MNLEQLMGRYFRLQQELSIAYRQQPWQANRIDRLADELLSTEREISTLRALPDEQHAAELTMRVAPRSVVPAQPTPMSC